MSRTSVAIPDGARAYLDASVLYWHWAGVGDEQGCPEALCVEVVARCAGGSLLGLTALGTVAELVHKVLLLDIRRHTGRDRAHLVPWLKRHPEVVAQAVEHTRVIESLEALGIEIVCNAVGDLQTATAISRQHGLLTNDALIVATMQRLGLSWLATCDDDFDRVPWLQTWKPTTE